jgi:nucleoside-diphosphate-sugar epimerase
LPIDEEHPSKPQDSYGLSKVVGERIADSIVAVHKGMTVASLRFPGIIFDFSYEIVRERWNDPKGRASGFWAYIDARDAARACRFALEADFRGHEVMIVAASRSSMKNPTDQLMEKYFPSVKKTDATLTGNWSGVSSLKAKRVINFTAHHLWEHYLTI